MKSGIYNETESGLWKKGSIWVNFVDRLPFLTLPREPYLNAHDACRYLGVSETTFRKSIKEQRIHHDEYGRFDREDLDDYLFLHNPDRLKLIASVRDDTRETLELIDYKSMLGTARAIAAMYGEEFLLSLIRYGYDAEDVRDVRAKELSDSSLGFTARARNCMRAMGIVHAGELEGFAEEDLWKYRNMGKKTLEEIRAFMLKHGLKLKDSHASHEG